ncbi:MAG: hypothetical protein QXN99_06945 [Nitrososphaerota archaeon]
MAAVRASIGYRRKSKYSRRDVTYIMRLRRWCSRGVDDALAGSAERRSAHRPPEASAATFNPHCL